MASSRLRAIARAAAPVAVITSLALVQPGLASAAVATRTAPAPAKTVAAGETWTVSATTRLSKLVIEDGASVVAPDEYSLTLTQNGVETGQALTETGGTDTALLPGTYRGNLVLTVAEANDVIDGTLTFPFRQALYVDVDGVSAAKSVKAAVVGGRISDSSASGVSIRSTGEAFNGLYNSGGTYTLKDSRIALKGNGRSDFVGYGAAVTSTGDGARTVLDHVSITNQGVVRTGVVADGGSNVIVEHSRIHTQDGTLPDDYVPTVDTTLMEQAPWMLGIVGNVRATNLLGTDTQATYLDSDISSSGWGVLSVDNGTDQKLTAINSKVHTTGDEGYGSYAIGGATEEFLGVDMDVASYAAINRGGAIHYGDSTPDAVSALNDGYDLELTGQELKAIKQRATTIDSKRFGVMWHGAGSVDIDGHTRVRTAETTFLDKGQQVAIDVDGSQGATVKTGNGVLVQVMEDDDPGPVMVDGKLVNEGVYTEPTDAPTKVDTFDVTTPQDGDATATFTDTTLKGDFYNAIRGNAAAGPFGPGMEGKNLDLTFDGSTVTGVISSSTSAHSQSTITSADYKLLGEVTNTPAAAINNGTIVDLTDSTWKVTGTSYLTSLTADAASRIVGAGGKKVTMTVDGVTTPIVKGTTYTGAIVLTLG